MFEYNYEDEPQGVKPFLDLRTDKRLKRYVQAIQELKNPNLLEIGMGQGQFLKKLSRYRPDAHLYGIDISQKAISAAQKDPQLKGDFQVGNAELLNFPDNFFDTVVIVDVLEHVTSPLKVILEVKRVLKPSGIFHFFVPCESQPATLDRFLKKTNFLGLGQFTKIHFGHIQSFTHADIISLLANHFESTSVSYSGHWLSQLLFFSTLYLPKHLISLFSKDIQIKTRDAFDSTPPKTVIDALINILKKTWLIISFPTTLIYELEAKILQNCAFAAHGLHYTGTKRIDNQL